MSDGRLPTHLEVGALIRAAEAAGGFATVLTKGERDAGTILIVTTTRGEGAALWERLPRFDGPRRFEIVRRESDQTEDHEFADYLKRRTAQDRDIWVVELDIRDLERFIAGWQS